MWKFARHYSSITVSLTKLSHQVLGRSYVDPLFGIIEDYSNHS